MSNSSDHSRAGDAIEQQAAAWVLRCDRGLTPVEQDEFSAWLAADPRHGAQLARHRRHWRRLDALAQWRPEHAASPNPDLLAPPLRVRLRRWTPAVVTFAAAAAITVFVWRAPNPPAQPVSTPVPELANHSPSNLRVLADGTTVELNRGAEFSVNYTAGARWVRLERGEAHFVVTKDLNRPFIVNAGGVDVRALGTAFNVRIDPAAVEVLVTEGQVQVDPEAAPGAAPAIVPSTAPIAVLEARQRAVVPLGQKATPPAVATLTPGEIERVLAWQHRLLDFNAAPLNEIVMELNRRNATQLLVIDPELASIRVSATFRSDNIDGFVRLLEAGFGAKAEKRGENEILLRKAK